MSKRRPTSAPRRPLRRFLMAVTGIIALLVIVPLGAFALWNAIDEDPSATALRLAGTHPAPVSDGENAWLILAGLGAAAEDDPVALGRRRVDAFAARAAQSPMPAADAAERALFEDVLPHVDFDPAIDGVAKACDLRETDCLEWALRHRVALERLRAANALRLERFEQMLTRPHWRDLHTESMHTPYPSATVSVLHLRLLALDLGQAEPDSAAASQALARLAAWVEFWRRVRSTPQHLIAIELSGRRIEDIHWLVSSWIDRASPASLAANAAVLDRILAPQAKALDWSVAAASEFRVLEHSLRDAMPGPAVGLWRCITRDAGEERVLADSGCLSQTAMNLAYAHQATMNIAADNYAQIQRILEATPQQLPQVQDEAGIAMNREFVRFDDVGVILEQMSYNYTGRILAAIAIPAFDYGKREHDREALRRMLQLKREARLAGIAPEAMAAFIAGRAEALRNPLDGGHFGWDPALRTLSFAPLAPKYWQRDVVHLDLPAPARTGVFACAEPVRFALAEVRDEEMGPILHFATCGHGGEAALLARDTEDPEAEAEDAVASRLTAVRAAYVGGRLGVRVEYESDRHEPHVWRGSVAPGEASRQALLDGPSEPTGARLVLHLTELSSPPMVAVYVQDRPAREVLRSIARVAALRIDGADRVGEERITMNFEISQEDVLELIADIDGTRLERRGERHYALRLADARSAN